MKLYIDCSRGITSERIVGALIAIGKSKEMVVKQLNTIPGFHSEIKMEERLERGVPGIDFLMQENVIIKYSSIEWESVIEQSGLTKVEQQWTKKMLELRSFGENIEIESGEVYMFAAAAIAFAQVEVEEVICSDLWEGRTLALEVVKLAMENNIRIHQTSENSQLITLDGLVIAMALATKMGQPTQAFRIKKCGVGFSKDEWLQIFAVELEEEKDLIYKLESNIDDCTGENLGYVMERLLEAGARDVHYMPVFMKKNRPAYQLNVICKKEQMKQLEQIIFEETTTIGIRKIAMERSILKREVVSFECSLGRAKVKICELEGRKKVYPEYESVVELCKKEKMPFGQVFQLIQKEYEEQI